MAFTPKPPTSVRSIRLPNDLWAQLAAEAASRETTVNNLLHTYAIVGLFKAPEAKATASKIMELKRVAPAPKVEPSRKPIRSRLKGEWKAP